MVAVPQDYTNIFRDAVRSFWQVRQSQGDKSAPNQGNRGQATGGRHLDVFAEVVAEILVNAGLSRSSIHYSKQKSEEAQVTTKRKSEGSPKVELPGFYRATKRWDIVIVTDGILQSAIELKSQTGPSFGNNFNNRVEEAVGSAADIWQAYRQGAFYPSPQPWLGYLFLMEDAPKSRTPIGLSEPHFVALKDFQGSSYIKRAELLCLKLLRERQYSAVCFLVSDKSRTNADPNYQEPSPELSVEAFMKSLLKHLGLPQPAV